MATELKPLRSKKSWRSGNTWAQRYPEKHKEYSRKYYQKNRLKLLGKVKVYDNSRRLYLRSLRRQNTLTSKGVRYVGLHKRTYTGYCELCEKEKERLVYHHWDTNVSKGLWLCVVCHWFVEGYEKGARLDKYLVLKENLNKEDGSNA